MIYFRDNDNDKLLNYKIEYFFIKVYIKIK